MGELSKELFREIKNAAQLLQSHRKGVALTGAGISTPSGIPDFRSAGSGLWTRYNPLEVASLSAFRYHPEKFYDWMRNLALEMSHVLPNPAHGALARLEEISCIRTVITQNIDGLHQRAGSTNVLEVHGSMRTLTCTGCYRQHPSTEFMGPYLETGEIPRCPECHRILKLDVVLFEEQLPIHTWLSAQEACRNCDLMLVAGSSLEVVPVAGLPMQALENGACLILINQSSTYLDVRADVILRGDVAEIMPRIVEEVHGE
jgi:NAD-dependent deacetylase